MSEIPILNVSFTVGATVTVSVSLRNMSADTPYSLAGWDGFAAELRTVAGGALIGLGVVTVGDAAEGTVTARFPRAVTALITTAAVAYDVFAVNPAGETLMLFRGHACPVVARATFTVPPA